MKLDHLVGQNITGILTGVQTWEWWLRFEGGFIVRNQDERRTAVPEDEIIGMSLIAVVENDDNSIDLQIGLGDGTVLHTVAITESQYQMAGPGRDAENPSAEEYNPADDLPPDPSPLRVVSGPEKASKTKPKSKRAEGGKRRG